MEISGALAAVQIPHQNAGRDRWGTRVFVSASVDFLLQVMIDDGLVIEPFTEHARHGGPLQRQGLTSSLWRDWMDNVVAEAIRAHGAALDPVVSWPGPTKLTGQVAAHWMRYKAAYEPSPARAVGPAGAPEAFSPGVIGAERFYGLPTLNTFVVRYQAAVIYMATPDVALIGDRGGELTGVELASLIVRAAQQQLELNS